MEIYYDKSPLIPEYVTVEEIQNLIDVISECNNIIPIVGIYVHCSFLEKSDTIWIITSKC